MKKMSENAPSTSTPSAPANKKKANCGSRLLPFSYYEEACFAYLYPSQDAAAAEGSGEFPIS